MHEHLTPLAAQQEIGEHGMIALDWHRGNRSVLVDHELSGLVVSLTLATRAEDVRAIMREEGISVPVIAKIEKPQAIANLDSIVAASDGADHRLHRAARARHPAVRPIRPDRVRPPHARRRDHEGRRGGGRAGRCVYVVAFTQSGDSVRRVARLRSRIAVLAFTPDPQVRSQLAMSWGVEAFTTAPPVDTDDMVTQVNHELLRSGRVREGDLVVIRRQPAGSPRLDQRALDPQDRRSLIPEARFPI